MSQGKPRQPRTYDLLEIMQRDYHVTCPWGGLIVQLTNAPTLVNLEKYIPVEKRALESEKIQSLQRYKWTNPPKLAALAGYCQVAFIACRDNEKLRTSNYRLKVRVRVLFLSLERDFYVLWWKTRQCWVLPWSCKVLKTFKCSISEGLQCCFRTHFECGTLK